MKKAVFALVLSAGLALFSTGATAQWNNEDTSWNAGYNNGYDNGKRDTMNYYDQNSQPQSLLIDRNQYDPYIDGNNSLSILGKENSRNSGRSGTGSLLNQ